MTRWRFFSISLSLLAITHREYSAAAIGRKSHSDLISDTGAPLRDLQSRLTTGYHRGVRRCHSTYSSGKGAMSRLALADAGQCSQPRSKVCRTDSSPQIDEARCGSASARVVRAHWLPKTPRVLRAGCLDARRFGAAHRPGPGGSIPSRCSSPGSPPGSPPGESYSPANEYAACAPSPPLLDSPLGASPQTMAAASRGLADGSPLPTGTSPAEREVEGHQPNWCWLAALYADALDRPHALSGLECMGWRKGGDSNPRGVLPPTRFPVVRTRPDYATLPYGIQDSKECAFSQDPTAH